MRVGDRYQSSDDANQQLHNTLVELDGDLCHLQRYDGWHYTVRGIVNQGKQRRWSKQTKNMSIKDMDLTLQQFPLGYVNNNGVSYYLKRKPLRKWKQGFYHEYIQLITNEDNTINPANGINKKRPVAKAVANPLVSKIFHSQAIVDLYDNNYPSLVRAWVQVHSLGDRSVAWHRHWAFGRSDMMKGRFRSTEVNLLYKGKIVGRVQKGDVILRHEFRYLTEPFVEAMIHAS